MVNVTAIVVTHAHSDHTGGLPVVHEAFPNAPVYATPPTIDLVRILQKDALKLMGMALADEGDFPLYSERQVDALLAAMRPLHMNAPCNIGDVELTLLPAGHILGASMAHLSTPSGNVLFTGDYSIGAQRTVSSFRRPSLPVDLVVTESTYGNRLHSDRKAAEQRLVERVAAVLERGGRVLIPAFAIGRAQEVLLILKQALKSGALPAAPVFVDGMVRSVCDVYSAHERYVSRELAHACKSESHPFFSEAIRPIRTTKDRRAAVDVSPAIIVASSGMLSGGASAFYATHFAPCERDAIFITGYQDEESPGRKLLRLAEHKGPREFRVADKIVPVACEFDTYSLSAHADRMQIAGFIESLRATTAILVHGDAPAKEALRLSLGPKDVVLAEDGTVVERHYRARRRSSSPKAMARALDDISKEAAERLLAGPADVPLTLAQIAEAWFGHAVPAPVRNSLADRLEALGVARRDDRRPTLIWSLVQPTDAEAKQAAELRAHNPKGRLLEWCAQRSFAAPTIQVRKEGHLHAVQVSVATDRTTVASEVHRCRDQKLAEQLAARQILHQLAPEFFVVGQSDAAVVSEEDAARLRLQNPKGKLLEICAKQHLKKPAVHVGPAPGGFCATLKVFVPGAVSVTTRPAVAATAKLAEQAAYEQALRLLIEQLPESEENAAATTTVTSNACVQLNELLQQGVVTTFGYELVATEGPSHDLEFVMSAWAFLSPTNERRTSQPQRARSKKDAKHRAAASLIECL